MTKRLGLRARLTIFVTVVFASTLTLTSVVVVDAVEDRLIADTRATAEAVLGGYLETIYGGVATVGVVDPNTTTSFFYLGSDGDEISEVEYFETIATGFDAQVLDGFDGSDLPIPFEVLEGVSAAAIGGPIFGESVIIDEESGTLVGPDGGTITFVTGPVPTGDPHAINRGPDVVAVAQTLTFADGATVDVGVSNPLQPVTDSLDTFDGVLWVGVPVLVAVTALITWLAASRALRPVKAIADQADVITANNLDQRVPIHGANDEIRHLGVTVNDMLERLHDSQKQQRQLVADASHELRSPVAATRAQLEVAIAHPDSADWNATAGAVLEEQERLAGLIDDLLALSRLDETVAGVAVDVDLDDLVATEAQRQTGLVDVSIPQPVRVAGNRQLITRAVRNLLDNATRYAAGQITVSVSADDAGMAAITIDDDGPGVPLDARESIFHRFTRLDEARDRDRGGAGLGLAIARQVARAHGGDLTCMDSPLGGARFVLTIPCAAEALAISL
jgi:signal transduction histidine kinase